MFRQFARVQDEPSTVLPPATNGEAHPAPVPEPVARAASIKLAAGRRGDFWTDLKVRLHQRLLEMLNLAAIDKVPVENLRREVATMIRELLTEEGVAVNAKEYNQLVEEVLDEVLGLGPLEPLLKDATVSDVLVNTHRQVFVERHGRLEITQVQFKDDDHLLRIIDKIVSRVGRRIDESSPWVDARLPDGSRVNAIIPPCSLDGPVLSIRKFTKIPLTLDRLIELRTVTPEIAEILKGVVRCRLNLLISGGTGSGKTTLLNAVSGFISNEERIITIEDAAELQLQQFHVVRLETRPPNVEGKGGVTQRDLVRNALRMRPDRIIVGEARGAEALDMLQAMNTGHDGSMTTVHANSCRDSLSRLEQMLLMTGFEFPLKSMRSQIASAIHVVVQLQRTNDGRRRLISLQEITGMEGDVVSMQEIFRFRMTGVDPHGNVLGHYEATGIRPRFADRLEAWSFPLPAELFNPNRQLG